MAASREDAHGQLLCTSWHDSNWIPALNQHNVLDYFSHPSNPFYDRTCNNEIVKMQRADPAQLMNMKGIEYMLLHVQEPILYVVRKVHRQAPDKVTPLANYYILRGIVYQCPDLLSIINSRLLSTLRFVNIAFTEALSYVRYNPSRGYYWEFPDDQPKLKGKEEGEGAGGGGGGAKQSAGSSKEEQPSEGQRRRVDTLLSELMRKFPPKAFAAKKDLQGVEAGGDKAKSGASSVTAEPKEGTTANLKRGGQFGSDNKLPDPKRRRT